MNRLSRCRRHDVVAGMGDPGNRKHISSIHTTYDTYLHLLLAHASLAVRIQCRIILEKLYISPWTFSHVGAEPQYLRLSTSIPQMRRDMIRPGIAS
jgi:hypothetical protein